MNKFIAFLNRPHGNYWIAEFDDDYFIINAWYKGEKTKLTKNREFILYNAFKEAGDLNQWKRVRIREDEDYERF